MADAAAELSKSAKKRAAKKARDAAAEAAAAAAAAAEAEAAAAAAAAAAKAKAKGKAKAAPAADAKAKAKAKAEPKAEAAPKAKAESKAGAKAKAEPAQTSAAGAKASAKGKAKAAKKPAASEEPQAPAITPEMAAFIQLDDGSGPAWEVSTSGKKAKKSQQKPAQDAAAEKDAGAKQKKDDVSKNAAKPEATTTTTAPRSKSTMTHLEQAQAEVERILNMKAPAPEAKVSEVPEGPVETATVAVPEKKVGIVIGPKGSKIQMLQEKTGVTRIDTTGEIFTVTGPPDAVQSCVAAIKELIEKGYCAMQYENFAESFVNVHPSAFPDIIGKQGSIIRKIKDELNVEVSIPDVPKDSPPAKKFKVNLAGSKEEVEKAKNVINDIVMYGHSELTHPNQVHEELDVEPRAYRYIIGKAGSEMKHIQHNWSVRVNIPREHSANEKVLIVGEQENVERAKAYVEKLIWNAENNAKGREKEDTEATGDHWGEEGAEEDWMKGYIYKR